MSVELGDKVRDKVTGFTGIAVSRIFWLYGCNRIGIQPPVGKDGKRPETEYFDEPQCEVVKKGVIKTGLSKHPTEAETGGPIDAPKFEKFR